MTTKNEIKPAAPVDGGRCAVDALLADVMRYRRGLGRYNFSLLPDDQRGLAALEAWEELENRINAHLYAVGIKVG